MHRGPRRRLQPPRGMADREGVDVVQVSRECQGCGIPLVGGRSDRKWCTTACGQHAKARIKGKVVDNTGSCRVCGASLEHCYGRTTICSKRCREWERRYPGVPHPSSTPRNCHYCGELILHRNSRDKWCSQLCRDTETVLVKQKADSRRCSSCDTSLAGYNSQAKTCRDTRCRTWAQRHPGVPHPTTQNRGCLLCGKSINHLNGKGKWCSDSCRTIGPDRAAYNAKARKRQQSDRGKAYRKAYQQANAKRRQQWARDARARNPEQYAGYWQKWYSANSHRNAERDSVRRARQLGNRDSVGVDYRDWQRLVRRYRGCCAYCGVAAEPLHMDHVIPLARGGRHAIGNVLPVCGHCNFTKHAMFLAAWRLRNRRELNHGCVQPSGHDARGSEVSVG